VAAKQIVVLGGGFAGLWSAVGAARKLDELRLGPADAQVTLINRDAFHGIRVRNYEPDLANVRVPLDEVLGPIGVRRVEGDVTGIDPRGKTVSLTECGKPTTLTYDRLVFALGSELARPSIPGLVEHGFDVDTYNAAARLNSHLCELTQRDPSPGRLTVVIVGAGLTGIEAATEMPSKLRAAIDSAGAAVSANQWPPRVLLIDHNPLVGSDMGDEARPVIEQALAGLRIETRLGVSVAAIGPESLTLSTGEEIATSTVVWCAGLRASPLARSLGVPQDRWGRVTVDEFLRIEGVPGVFAAGDVARATLDGTHASVMSCQHGRPMGRFAGHNVVCDLFGQPMLPLHIDWYVTVLDLGPAGALYTEGWDRHVVATGATAKVTKQTINCQRIYPPLTGIRSEILAAAAPIVQGAPSIRS
jgi:NADH:ubiquinone reductase (H+-translocating)